MQSKMRKTCKISAAVLCSILIVIAIVVYSQYLALKKNLISRITNIAAETVGQRVEIGDIYLDPTASIIISDVAIKSPEGFSEENLLRIKKVRLDMRFRELFSGSFSFRNIEVAAPELFFVRKNGSLNISDKLREFLAKKGSLKYQIDELHIKDAAFGYNSEPSYRIEKTDMIIKNLSSATDAKTSFRVSAAYLSENSLKAEGWIYLKDESKKFSISAESKGIKFEIFREKLQEIGADFSKTGADVLLSAEGDIKQGIVIKASGELKSRGFLLFGKADARTIFVDSELFLDTKKESLEIRKAVLKTDKEAAVEATGALNNVFNDPHYSGEMRIGRLDLSSFNLAAGIKAEGIVTSGPVRISGRFSEMLPRADGTIFLRNGGINHSMAVLQGVDAKIDVHSGKEFFIKAEADGRILKTADIIFSRPAAVRLTADAKQSSGKVLIESRVKLSGLELNVNGKSLSVADIAMSYDGRVTKTALSGRSTLNAKGFSYDIYKADSITAALAIEHDSRKTTIMDMNIKSGMLSASGDMITFARTEAKVGTDFKGININASYPELKAGVKSLSLSGRFKSIPKQVSGDISFEAGQIMLRGITAEKISGSGHMSDREFSVNASSNGLFGGHAALSAKGGTQLFPVELKAEADRINLSMADEALRSAVNLPYHAAGSAKFRFDGTLKSKEEIHAVAFLKGGDIAFADSSKRALLKGAALNSEAVFRGRDIDVKTDISLQGIAVNVSGTAEKFLSDDRLVRFSILLPETKLESIRTALWDIFPDRFLYAGLQGSTATTLLVSYSRTGISAEGFFLLRDISLEGENSEYFIGPLNGMLPVHYSSIDRSDDSDYVPSYELSDYGRLRQSLSDAKHLSGNEIKIGRIRYGFRLFDDISLLAEQKGSSLKINRFSAKMFGGNIYGTAFIDSHNGLTYSAGMIAERVSLESLCEEIPPIKGYISGKIDGIASIKGSGPSLDKIVGKADFWTYTADGEKTRISREFLEKIGGPQVKAYLGERPFSKGVMGLYIKSGFLIFRELEISNRNLIGITDLSVKVAPLNNRIAIDHLMWTIIEAAQRAKKE